jgi:DNA-binding beta-propeller fold protein YncE
MRLDGAPPVSAAGGCGNQPGAPSGLIVDKVTTSPAWGIAVRDDGFAFFTAVFDGGVGITSTKTRKVDGFIPTGFVPTGVAFTPDGATAYVRTVLRTFFVGGVPQDVAVTRRGDRLYVANAAGYLNEITLQSGAVTATIPLSGGAFGIGVTANDAEAYVSIPFSGQVQVFKLQNRQLTRTLAVGGQPRRIGFSQQGAIGAIANLDGSIKFVR